MTGVLNVTESDDSASSSAGVDADSALSAAEFPDAASSSGIVDAEGSLASIDPQDDSLSASGTVAEAQNWNAVVVGSDLPDAAASFAELAILADLLAISDEDIAQIFGGVDTFAVLIVAEESDYMSAQTASRRVGAATVSQGPSLTLLLTPRGRRQ
jgi:uncharacterized protein GlcG (DUF336 family)